MNSFYCRSITRPTRPGHTMVKLILLIVLTGIVAGSILLVPHLLNPPADEPTESLVAPRPASPSPMAPQTLDLRDLPGGEPSDWIPEDEPAASSADAADDDPAPDASPGEIPTDDAPPVPETDAPEAAPEADGAESGSPLPRLEEVDAQTLLSPRQSALLLPALRRYEIDLSKGQVLLNDVRDETEKFDEAPLYWVLNVCRALPRELFIPGPAEHEASWTRLRQVPDTYRGWPITISGRVGSVMKWELPHAEIIGIERVWIIELYKPMTGGQRMTEVCTLFVTDDPGDLPLHTPIRARGFFFKIRSYEKEHQVGRNQSEIWNYFSPVVIGKALVIDRPIAVVREEASALGPIIVVSLIVFLLIVLVFVRRIINARAAITRETLRMQYSELSDEERRQRVAYLDQIGNKPPKSPPS